MPDSRVESIAGIERAIKVEQRRFCSVDMSNVVLCRVARASFVEQMPHCMLKGRTVFAFCHDIVLMEHVTQKVAVVDLVDKVALDILRERFEPVVVVASKCNIKRNDIFNLSWMDCPISHRSSGNNEAMQECLARLHFRTLEVVELPKLTRIEKQ